MQGPNQRFKSTKNVLCSTGEKVSLPAGAYIKAIKKCYLPRDHTFGDYDERLYTAAHSQYGMILVARIDIEWNVY